MAFYFLYTLMHYIDVPMSVRSFIGESTGSNQKYLQNIPNYNSDEIEIITKTPAEPKSFAKPDLSPELAPTSR